MKKKNNKKIIFIILLVIFIGIFIFSLSNIFGWFKDNKSIDNEVEQINKITSVEEVQDSDKTQIIENSLTQDLDINEICRILSVPESHPVFDFIGTKTIFWKASFETFDCNVYAIFAAIPDTRNHKKIDKYILIEKSVKMLSVDMIFYLCRKYV